MLQSTKLYFREHLTFPSLITAENILELYGVSRQSAFSLVTWHLREGIEVLSNEDRVLCAKYLASDLPHVPHMIVELKVLCALGLVHHELSALDSRTATSSIAAAIKCILRHCVDMKIETVLHVLLFLQWTSSKVPHYLFKVSMAIASAAVAAELLKRECSVAVGQLDDAAPRGTAVTDEELCALYGNIDPTSNQINYVKSLLSNLTHHDIKRVMQLFKC